MNLAFASEQEEQLEGPLAFPMGLEEDVVVRTSLHPASELAMASGACGCCAYTSLTVQTGL